MSIVITALTIIRFVTAFVLIAIIQQVQRQGKGYTLSMNF